MGFIISRNLLSFFNGTALSLFLEDKMRIRESVQITFRIEKKGVFIALVRVMGKYW